MSTRFEILGPVRARRGAAELDLGGPQQRTLLALLLARAGSVVSLGELVDAIWPDDPPASAVNTVQRAIGTLRRLIEPGLPVRAAGSHLARHASGYRLRVADDDLDLLRFRALAGRARGLADPDQAVRLYAEALQLWQGRLWSGSVSVTRTTAVFAAIEAELARAARDGADLALASGQVRTMMPALLRIGGLRPLDEALQARIILALAAEGRQAEAVATFHEVRTRLVDDLGIEPGAELRHAYDQVLHQRTQPAPDRRSPLTPAVPDRTPPLAQLPADQPFFIGREDVLRRSLDLLAEDRRLGRPTVALAFDGGPGIGKSTLAVHLGHRLARSFPDGQLYVDLRDLTAEDALRGVLGSLGVRPEDQPASLTAAAGLFRGLLAGRRMLLVLDDCTAFEQVRHLLPGDGKSLALVTSRRRITELIAAGAHPLPLGLLSRRDAHDGLVRRLGRQRVEAAPAPLRSFLDWCGRHPLTLATVAARLPPGAPLAAMVAVPGPPQADVVAVPGPPQADVVAVPGLAQGDVAAVSGLAQGDAVGEQCLEIGGVLVGEVGAAVVLRGRVLEQHRPAVGDQQGLHGVEGGPDLIGTGRDQAGDGVHQLGVPNVADGDDLRHVRRGRVIGEDRLEVTGDVGAGDLAAVEADDQRVRREHCGVPLRVPLVPGGQDLQVDVPGRHARPPALFDEGA
ncbi:hypothetical protein ACTI_47530 [Actinoplanes sp. OR16]|nr:BTAD domain-containing putative transcriptional regulator [Actinoplanes sp. OR16]BBH68068.1 hypothetical protein ACTI_47530 [Actinoplanes sp. OR16]